MPALTRYLAAVLAFVLFEWGTRPQLEERRDVGFPG